MKITNGNEVWRASERERLRITSGNLQRTQWRTVLQHGGKTIIERTAPVLSGLVADFTNRYLSLEKKQ